MSRRVKKTETILEKIKTDFKIDITELSLEEQRDLMVAVKEYVTTKRIKGIGIFFAIAAWMGISVGALIAGLSDISPSVTYAGISSGFGMLLSGGIVLGKTIGKEDNPTPCYEYIGELFDKYAAENGKKWENLCFGSDEKFIDLVRQLGKLPFSMDGKRKTLK